MAEEAGREIPWPGPRPYEEKHWRMFYGRAAEVRRVVSSIGANALSVLLGGSGTGKTSLVRAGAVPELRNRRYHPRGSSTQWPVLILRRWGAETGTTIDRILYEQLKVAIDALDEWAQREEHKLASVDATFLRCCLRDGKTTDSIPDTLLRMATGVAEHSRSSEAVDHAETGLIIVFDQFEELLRPGGPSSSEAIRVIRELYQRGSKLIHILLSLRQEFVYALRPLESTVGGLARRSIVLSPMPEKTVLEVIREASYSSDIRILEEAAAKIVKWLAETTATGQRGFAAKSTVVTNSVGDVTPVESAGSPDLLKLQAVLREIFVFAQKLDMCEVDLKVLSEFAAGSSASSLRMTNDDEGRVSERIVNGALERWIEYALEKELPEEALPGLSSLGQENGEVELVRSFKALTRDWPDGHLRSQVRRIAIRIAPHLTALDYKVPQEENALFRLALGDEVWKLGMKNASNRDKIRIVDDEAPRLNWDDLEISEVLLPSEQHYLSGIARTEEWSPAETGSRLAACFRETLHRLKQGNILTRIVKAGGEGMTSSVWELVHDQFGPTFLKWSHEHKDSWHDCESSLTVSNGVQPIMAPGDLIEPSKTERKYVVNRISWRGCSVEPGEGQMLILRNVHFVDCYLVGMVFDRCRFEGGSFENCNLNGALFRSCEFVDIGAGPPIFERCDPGSFAIVNGSIDGLEFRNCELQQPTIQGTLQGRVIFGKGSRVALAYFEISAGHSEKSEIVFERGSRAFFCSADMGSLELIKYGAQRDVASGALPEGFFERRAKQTRRFTD